MSIYKIEKPKQVNISKTVLKILEVNNGGKSPFKLVEEKSFSSPYYYWDEIKYRPSIEGLSKEELWALIKFQRSSSWKKIPVNNENGDYFKWVNKLVGLEQFFHQVDLNMGGNLFTLGKDIEEKSRYKFILRGIMEEAIASSQLEGANTTREAAKKMLREGRKPKTRGEQMILNNYYAMKSVEEGYRNKNLDSGIIMEMHGLLVRGTIPDEEVGRLRKDEENIIVGHDNGTIYHIPPKVEFVNKELAELIKFANDENTEEFIHPVIRAIILHFWIAYLHPFTDGNGRLARLLFYWYLLKKDYWAFAYLPISKVIKRSPAQYSMSYVYSEQDDLDMTYFIDYNIRKIKLAMQEFEDYLKKKSYENVEMRRNAQNKFNLNERQIQLLQYLYQNKEDSTSWKTHMNIYQVSKETAILDLRKLEKSGLLNKVKRGRNVAYFATEKIKGLFH